MTRRLLAVANYLKRSSLEKEGLASEVATMNAYTDLLKYPVLENYKNTFFFFSIDKICITVSPSPNWFQNLEELQMIWGRSGVFMSQWNKSETSSFGNRSPDSLRGSSEMKVKLPVCSTLIMSVRIPLECLWSCVLQMDLDMSTCTRRLRGASKEE